MNVYPVSDSRGFNPSTSCVEPVGYITRRSKPAFCRICYVLLLAAALPGGLFFAATPAKAQTFSVLHTFAGFPNDGDNPEAGVLDLNGTLYGTTSLGGSGPCKSQGVSGCGIVYSMNTAGGNYKVLYNFKGGKDGYGPGLGTLISDGKGNLYGATVAGGTGTCKDETGVTGCGTVFKITTAGVETVIYSFQGPSSSKKDGWAPMGALVRDSAGNIYGSTAAGGSQKCADSSPYTGCGTVYKVTSAGVETILYNFKGGTDGSFPFGGLVTDSAGNLYGTTTDEKDASEAGSVFKVTKSGTKTVLYRFTEANRINGVLPLAGLVIGSSDDLYGTASAGGVISNDICCGTVFNELASGGNPTILHDFVGGITDGGEPVAALALASSTLYGTTIAYGTDGAGVVFEVGTGGSGFKVLANINGTTDGADPYGTLAVDSKGNLYGTMLYGGNAKCVGASGTPGCGTVFKVVP
jgi:uncharacterized repeat protein (TIGR03803 family)